MFVLNFQHVLIGIIATFTMDVLSVAAIQLRMIAPLPPHLIGRWFASVARGQVFHSGQVSPINREMTVAVPVHYAIGVTLALLYFLVVTAFGLNQHSPITSARLRPVHEPSPMVADVSRDGVWLVRCTRPYWNSSVFHQLGHPLLL